MRINPTGYALPSDRIMAIITDEIQIKVFDSGKLSYDFIPWAYRHEDDTYTVHFSYNGISDPGMTEPIIVENPMIMFANVNPTINKILKAIEDSGIV